MDDPDILGRDDGADRDRRVSVLPPEPGDAAADAALVPLRYRFDGWTAFRQRRFLTSLGESGCIRDACRAVGMSKTSAYRLRARSAAFAAEWDCAMAMAATVLEQVAFQRAVIGVEEDVWHYGKHMGTRRRYSDGLLRLLIMRGDLRAGMRLTPDEKIDAAREAARVAGGFFALHSSAEDTSTAILAKLEARARAVRAADAVVAERLLRAGLVP